MCLIEFSERASCELRSLNLHTALYQPSLTIAGPVLQTMDARSSWETSFVTSCLLAVTELVP